MNLQNIQAEVAAWSQKNFGDQPAWRPLLGIGEELGELNHAYLKREQGIRQDEDHDAAMRDAVGDIVIFLCDFSSRARFPMPTKDYETILKDTTKPPNAWSPLLLIGRNLGRLNEHYLYDQPDAAKWDIVRIFKNLQGFCLATDINLHAEVCNAWLQVKERDWRGETGQ